MKITIRFSVGLFISNSVGFLIDGRFGGKEVTQCISFHQKF